MLLEQTIMLIKISVRELLLNQVLLVRQNRLQEMRQELQILIKLHQILVVEVLMPTEVQDLVL
ncbi:hypothetical protein D3C86_2204300 [compost metagenome]